MAQRDNLDFLRQSIRNLRTVGSIARSSPQLCRRMVSHVPFSQGQCLVELGAGDGAITEHLLQGMHPESRLFIFEVNEQFAEILRQIPDKRVSVIQDSAEHLEAHLAQQGVNAVDAIISAIPFVMLPSQLTDAILQAAYRQLKPGGLFIQFNYSLTLKKKYQEVFDDVRFEFEPINIPPTFVFICRKQA